MAPRLPAAPPSLVDPQGRLLHGLWAGTVHQDPVRVVRRRGGRVRRWSYAAACSADGRSVVGAALVDIGLARTAFAWALLDDDIRTWEHTAVGAAGVVVPSRPAGSASARTSDATVVVDGRGGLRLDLPVETGRLRADIRPAPRQVATTPAVCATPTPKGGWNVTRKHAGYAVEGRVQLGGRSWELGEGGGWSDWTSGRQDRSTTWRWAAGAGRGADGRRVGLNVSTGMNGAVGEDVVWWDGVPCRLEVTDLGPVDEDRPDGAWWLGGDGWGLSFRPRGARQADESLVVVRSRYVQPVGTFTGTLPGRDGAPIEVGLTGVTEDHAARW